MVKRKDEGHATPGVRCFTKRLGISVVLPKGADSKNASWSVYFLCSIRSLCFALGFFECLFRLCPHIVTKEELTDRVRVWECVLRGQRSLVILANLFYLLILGGTSSWAWRNRVCQDLRGGDTGQAERLEYLQAF
jgi:hypothetical protein